MKTLFACFLFVLVRQVASKDLPILEHASVIKERVGIAPIAAGSRCDVEGLIGCTNDCKSQRFCFFNQEITINCEKQTGFYPNCNHETSECTSAAVKCPDVENPDFKCPGIGFYPHALNCTRLWQCTPNKPPQMLQCDAGFTYDARNKKCSPASGSNPCYTFSYGIGACRLSEGTLVTHPRNNGIYAYCNGSFPQINECPSKHVFDRIKLRCEFECTEAGTFKDILEDRCYYICTESNDVFKKERSCCEANQIFDEDLSACIFV